MKVKLERTISDWAAGRKYALYRREDGKFFVLATPTNPDRATKENVNEFVLDTRQEALDLCIKTQP